MYHLMLVEQRHTPMLNLQQYLQGAKIRVVSITGMKYRSCISKNPGALTTLRRSVVACHSYD